MVQETVLHRSRPDGQGIGEIGKDRVEKERYLFPHDGAGELIHDACDQCLTDSIRFGGDTFPQIAAYFFKGAALEKTGGDG